MKTTHTCPKCHGRQLWCIERLRYRDTVGVAHPQTLQRPALRVAEGRDKIDKAGTLARMWHGSSVDTYDAGHIDAYLCAACGYTELWSNDFGDLVHNPAAGVHFIDARTSAPAGE